MPAGSPSAAGTRQLIELEDHSSFMTLSMNSVGEEEIVERKKNGNIISFQVTKKYKKKAKVADGMKGKNLPKHVGAGDADNVTDHSHTVYVDLRNKEHEQYEYNDAWWRWTKVRNLADGDFMSLRDIIYEIEFFFGVDLKTENLDGHRFYTHELRSIHNALAMYTFKFAPGHSGGTPFSDDDGSVVHRFFGMHGEAWEKVKHDPAAAAQGGASFVNSIRKLPKGDGDGSWAGMSCNQGAREVTCYERGNYFMGRLKSTNFFACVLVHEFTHIPFVWGDGDDGVNKEAMRQWVKHYAYWRYKMHKKRDDPAAIRSLWTDTSKGVWGWSDKPEKRKNKCAGLDGLDCDGWTELNENADWADQADLDTVIWHPPITNYSRCSVQENISESAMFACYGIKASYKSM
mmetsp:Transcript_24457/g.61341  ORF Transcript_24457/g.61341 Transcript_24457/m.61341 type:complete len:402 (-) Transcript_24457:334-1539(-)